MSICWCYVVWIGFSQGLSVELQQQIQLYTEEFMSNPKVSLSLQQYIHRTNLQQISIDFLETV